MMYALANRSQISAMLNMALQVQEREDWSATHYFLSLAPRDSAITSGLELLQAGSV